MTICVARTFGPRALLSCDTAISSAIGKRRYPLQGALKNWRLSAHLGVAYAGNPHTAVEALSALVGRGANLEDMESILTYLAASTRAGTVDYLLLAHTAKGSEIWRISAGEVESGLAVAHIGDSEVFSKIQEATASGLSRMKDFENIEDVRLEGAFSSAFAEVVSDCAASKDAGVGGFALTLMGDGSELYYQPQGAIYSGMPVTVPAGKGWRPVPFGNAATGAYAISVCTPPKGDDAVAVGAYLPIGRVGALYAPMRQRDVEEAIIYRDVSHDEFLEKVKAEHDVRLSGLKIGP